MNENLWSFVVERWKNSKEMWASGQTLFEIHDTYGLPLSVAIEHCKAKGYRVDLTGLKAELKYNYGWNDEKIEAALRD